MSEVGMKMLSMRVAEVLEILVGLLIIGKSDCEKLISMNSLVGACVSEFRRFKL
jgi:hypothetical protein